MIELLNVWCSKLLFAMCLIADVQNQYQLCNLKQLYIWIIFLRSLRYHFWWCLALLCSSTLEVLQSVNIFAKDQDLKNYVFFKRLPFLLTCNIDFWLVALGPPKIQQLVANWNCFQKHICFKMLTFFCLCSVWSG